MTVQSKYIKDSTEMVASKSSEVRKNMILVIGFRSVVSIGQRIYN